MRRLRTTAAAFAIAALAFSPSTVASASGSTGTVEPHQVSQQAQRIERYAAKAFPDRFTGVALGAGERSVIVYRKPDPLFDGQVRQRFPDTPVTFVGTTASERELTALSDRVVGDMAYWQSRGVDIRCVGPWPAASAVRVGVASDVGAATSTLRRHYGRAWIRVEHCEPVTLGMPATP